MIRSVWSFRKISGSRCQGKGMQRLLTRWLNLYQDEIALFLWSALLLFLIRTSNILFNNFAETAFLKRFGVQYLPYITAANSVSTFFIMGLLTGFMVKMPGSRLFSYTLLFCGASVAALRLVVPLDISFLYPVLYVLKTQYEVLLTFLFWNLANDLFNTRQSKRIFPLITAGGLLGGIIGSFGTPALAEAVSINNLMVMYLFTTFAGAVVVKRMGDLYPTVLVMGDSPSRKKASFSMMNEIKKILPMVRESQLAKVLILLTLLPNIVIPIMNYQFSVAVDHTYHTENGMLAFFGYFRGSQNTIALVISLFVGRLYARFGLPVALMFHPFNYLLAFFAFLFRFDIFSAMYARLSTAVLRQTINAPARAVLYGLFPLSYRNVIRPFLRGTVVRVGVLAGSGIVLLSQPVMQPRYLSLVGAVVVLAWIGTTIFFRKNYSKILTNLISSETFDFRALEEKQALQVFRDRGMQSRLTQSFLSSHGDDCVWYGRLLRSLGLRELDGHILSKLRAEDDRTRMKLLSLLSTSAGEEAVDVFRDLIDPAKPELMIAFARTLQRIYAGMPLELQKEIFEKAHHPEVKACMIIGLYARAPREYGTIIDSWLVSHHLAERRAGVLAAGALGSTAYAERLREMLAREEDDSILPLILEALHRPVAPDVTPDMTRHINELAIPFLSHASESVRAAALEVLDIESEETAREVVSLMGDPVDRVRDTAIEKLSATAFPVGRALVTSLTLPSRRIREGIFRVFKTLQVKDVEVFRFFQSQIQMGYMNLATAESLKRFAGTAGGDLLIEHLTQEKDAHVENVVRTLAVRDPEGKMRIIWRGLASGDARHKANSIEALESIMDPSLSRILVPLLEEGSLERSLAVGRKHFKLPPVNADASVLFPGLLETGDWVTTVLTLNLMAEQKIGGILPGILEGLSRSENTHIRKTAQFMAEHGAGPDPGERFDAQAETSILDRILHLKQIAIFQELSVKELAVIASVAEEFVRPAHESVLQSGDIEDRMHCIVNGEVSVMEETKGQARELFRLGAGETLGEVTFFAEIPSTVSARTNEETRFLALSRGPFTEILREYPEIALGICRDLGSRLLMLHEKIKACDMEWTSL